MVFPMKTLEEVLSGVYRMTITLPFRGTEYLNIYILKDEVPTVIDTGIGDQMSVEKLITGLKTVGFDASDNKYVITTHEHIEHFGGNKDVKDEFRAEVFAHRVAAETIEGFHEAILELGKLVDRIEIPQWDKERMKLMMRFNLMIKTAAVDHKLEDGDVISLGSRELKVVYTPGHSLGHICLYDEEQRILFTGDHVLGEGTPFVGSGFGGIFHGLNAGRKWWFEGDMDLYMKSLEKVLKLKVDVMLPAHGPISTKPHERIKETLERKRQREKMLLEVLQRGRKDLDSIVRELYGEASDEYIVRGATLGYLDKLVKEGKVRPIMEERGKLYFELI